MKIEKINDNQIRCTLTHSDLANRELKISELAYGSDKAKSLFKDMMEQASYEFGFEADDIPLMIEAVPISSECIVLTITKVEDPEELDTRFSKFAPSVHEDSQSAEEADDISDISEEVMDLFHKIQKSERDFMSDVNKSSTLPATPADAKVSKEKSEKVKTVEACIFSFESLSLVIRFAHAVNNFTICKNSLYKDKKKDEYHLIIFNHEIGVQEFNQLSNAASEYGHLLKSMSHTETYYKEHFEPIVENHALQSLGTV